MASTTDEPQVESTSNGQLAVGQVVRLKNLKAASLNGSRGTVLQWEALTGRWKVDLGEAGIKALLPSNLEILEEAQASEADKMTEEVPPDQTESNEGSSSAPQEPSASTSQKFEMADLMKMKVKELKQILDAGKVIIPPSVSEKADLAAFVFKVMNAPQRTNNDHTPEKTPERPETETKDGSSHQAHSAGCAGATFGGSSSSSSQPQAPHFAHPQHPQMPFQGTGWPPSYGWNFWPGMPAPAYPQAFPFPFGPMPFMPNMPFAHPTPTMPHMPRPVARGASGATHRPPLTRPQTPYPVKHPPQQGLPSRERAVEMAKARAASIAHSENSRQAIKDFGHQYGLCKGSRLAMRMLSEAAISLLISDRELTSKMRSSNAPHEVLMAAIQKFDPFCAAVLKVLANSQHRKTQKRRASRSNSSRSKRRRLQSESQTRRSLSLSPKPRGVWDDRGASPVQASPVREPVEGRDCDREEIENWLVQLDGGKGAARVYLEKLFAEFRCLPSLTAAVMFQSEGPSKSVIGRIDSSFWKAIGVASLGHRLLLAKGLIALDDELNGSNGN